MKKKLSPLGLLVVLMLEASVASTTQAEIFPRHELLFTPSAGSIQFNDTRTALAFSGGYNYRTHENLQWGVFPIISYSSAPSSTAFSILVGPTFNFPLSATLSDSFFAAARAGLSHSTGVGSSTDFTFAADVGKRFPLGNEVTYRPTVSLEVRTGSQATFVLNVVAFSAIL